MSGGGADSEVPVTIRRAEPRDREAVIAIDENAYAGLDYLPTAYTSWMGDPETHYCCVAEQGDRVVAFRKYLVTRETGDGTVELLAQGGRVCADLQGRGVFKALSAHMKGELVGRYPAQRQLSVALNLTKYWEDAVRINKARLIQKSGIIRGSVSTEDLRRFADHPPDMAKRHMANVTMKMYNGDQRLDDRYIPDVVRLTSTVGPYIIYGCPWAPHYVTEQYLKSLFPDLHVQLSLSDAHPEAFSVRNLFPVKIGMRLDVFYFGHSLESLVAHFHGHVAEGFRQGLLGSERVALCVHFPMPLGVAAVEEALTEVIGELNRVPETEVWLMEKLQ